MASADVFDNSVRRDATADEAGRVGRINTTCTLFFLENNTNAVYAVTARHCFDNHDITSWCANDGVFSTGDAPGSNNGQCLQVLASDETHDIAVFEATLTAPLTVPLFHLASYTPAANTNIDLTGYPADPERNGALTTSTDCWILGAPGPSPFPDDVRMSDQAVHHNCSVYGGNSGGPVWVDKTLDVVGLPFNYHQDDSDDNPLSSNDIDDAPVIALMSDFLSVHSDELSNVGITISDVSSVGPTIDAGESLTGSTTGALAKGKSTAADEDGVASSGCTTAPGRAESALGWGVGVLAITALRRRKSSRAR